MKILVIVLLIAYLFFNFWYVTRRILIAIEEISYKNQLQAGDRAMAATAGLFIAVVFPVISVLVILWYDFFETKVRIFHTPNERAKMRAEQQEAKIKKLAEENIVYRRLLKEYDLKDPSIETELRR